MRIDFESDADEQILRKVDTVFRDRLGPAIADQVRRNCPVDTGALRESTDHHVSDHVLYVTATGDETRTGSEAHKYYAAWQDSGYHLVAWGHPTGRWFPGNAYMRRALFGRRYS
jgi:hypothetical protein